MLNPFNLLYFCKNVHRCRRWSVPTPQCRPSSRHLPHNAISCGFFLSTLTFAFGFLSGHCNERTHEKQRSIRNELFLHKHKIFTSKAIFTCLHGLLHPLQSCPVFFHVYADIHERVHSSHMNLPNVRLLPWYGVVPCCSSST